METEVSALFRQYFENLERKKTERFSYDKFEKEENPLKEVFIGINEVVTSPEFDDDLREILSRTFENYSVELKEREDDLFKRDCAIMVVGDTSTGKSTLINLLLDENILDTGVFACTKKIYKLIGSDSIKVKTYSAEKTVLDESQKITSLEDLKFYLREIEADDLDKESTSESCDSSSDDTDSVASDSNDNDENVDKKSITDTTLTVGPSGTNEGEVFIPKYTQESLYKTSKYKSYQQSAQESVFHEESPDLDFPGGSTKFTSTLSYSNTCASDFLETSFQKTEGGYKSELTKEWKRKLKETKKEAPDKDSKRNTDRQICQEVEIYYPSTKLKGNVMIVDSPGFGESEELDQRLRDYIKSAVSFIFVTDVNRGGGLQKEGILRVLHEIKQCQDSMFSFDPSDVIFVSNKWDSVPGDKQQIRSVKKETKHRIKKAWPGIKKDHIFFLSVGKVDHSEKYLKEYKKFEKLLLEVLEANENKRAKTNFRFLDDFFRHIVRIIRPRYDGLFQNEEKTYASLRETRLRLEKLKNISTETEKKHDLRIQKYVEDLAYKVFSFLQKEEFKEIILSEKKMKWSTMPKKEISSEVTKRIEHETRHIIETEASMFLENDTGGILADFDNIMREIRKTDTQLSGLQISHRLERTIPFSVFKFDVDEVQSVALLSILTGMRYGPGIGFAIGAGCLCVFAFKHLTEVWKLKGPNDEIAREVFTKINSGTDVTKIKEMLDKSFGNWYRTIISRLFNCIIPGEIDTIGLSIEGMENEISILKSKQRQLQDLNSKLDELEEKINACSKTILMCKTE